MKKKKQILPAWKDTRPLSPLREGFPLEAVARLVQHEALTASPKANFNLFQWNGKGDVWRISHCLETHFNQEIQSESHAW